MCIIRVKRACTTIYRNNKIEAARELRRKKKGWCVDRNWGEAKKTCIIDITVWFIKKNMYKKTVSISGT